MIDSPPEADEEAGLIAGWDRLSWLEKTLALIAAAIVLAFIVAFFESVLAHAFFRLTGTRNESGGWYGFWSGFGGSIPDFLLLGGLITLFHHHNCSVKGCPRIGKKVDGTAYLACHVHHPGHRGRSRNVDVSVIHDAHDAHIERTTARTPAPAKARAATKRPARKEP